jgi:predicted phage-related endonuclease
MTNAELNERINKMRELEAQAAILKKQAEVIKDELKAELDDRKADSVDTGSHKIFYTAYEKASVDTSKLKAAGLYDFYKKVSTVLRFQVTDVQP